MEPNLRQALRNALIVSVRVPWAVFPVALRGALHWGLASMLGTMVAATSIFAQTTRSELDELSRDHGVFGVFLWIIGALMTGLSMLATALVVMWARQSKKDDIYRKELLGITEKALNSMNAMASSQQAHNERLDRLTSQVAGNQQVLQKVYEMLLRQGYAKAD